MQRLSFREGNNLVVFRLGTTSNDKIEANKKRQIVQTYTFSKSQFEYIRQGKKDGMKGFFSIADSNCLDCPFNSFGKCYTHKFNQYVGFISMIKSIVKEYSTFDSLPELTEGIRAKALSMSAGTYVRFGTYGEPSVLPTDFIHELCLVADIWTGYTHQWFKKPELAKYFMASTHNPSQEQMAAKLGYRSYVASGVVLPQFVQCPASKEANYKSSCSKCGLCSGTMGKGKKSVTILEH